MKTVYDDCWAPSPGTWEEQVEPYEVQRARFDMQKPPEEQKQLPFEMIPEPQSPASMMTSLSA